MYDIEVAWANRKRGWGGDSRTPVRWARARINAHVHPDSTNARIFRERCEIAGRAAEIMGPGRIFEEYRNNWTPNCGSATTRDHITCSAFCAGLDAAQQLGRTCDKIENVIAYLRRHETLPGTLKRPNRCFVCGRTVFPDGHVEGKSIWDLQLPTAVPLPSAEELLAKIVERALKLNERKRTPRAPALEKALEFLNRA